MSLKPPALQPGDTIGVMAPSSHVDKADIETSKALLEKRGFRVFIHPQTYERHNQSAGTALQKSLALQGLWQRQDIKAIWAAGGGNRALHFMDSLNYKALKKNPKIFIGFSDVTALLNSIYAHTGIITFHGPVFRQVHKYKQLDHLLGLLAGDKASYPMEDATVGHHGSARGRLVGGNLSLFQYLPQTLPGSFWKKAILFLEDCGDDISRIDRMFLHLKRLGVLNDIHGLVLGQFTDLGDSGRPYGFTLPEIVAEHTAGLDIPVVMDAPFGHGKTLYTLPVGGKALIETKKITFRLYESATAPPAKPKKR